MRVLFVHGIGPSSGQSVSDGAGALAADWVSAIAGGASAVDRARLTSMVEVVYYRDWSWLPDSGNQGSGGDRSAYQEELARALLEAAAAAEDEGLWIQARQELAKLDQLRAVDDQGALRVARSAVDALSRVPVFASGGMKVAKRLQLLHLEQVDDYVNDLHGSKAAVLSRFGEKIEYLGGPLVVIAHSLGSVVAYEALHEFGVEADLFLTIGSPLGIRNVVFDRLIPPATYPKSVGNWLNFADPDDVVAAERHLAGLFVDADERLVDHEVHNEGAFNWHRATSYLSHDIVRSSIWDALT